jgi:hypothetical protein
MSREKRPCALEGERRRKVREGKLKRETYPNIDANVLDVNFKTLSFINIGISIGTSLIPNGGSGIFAQRCFHYGDVSRQERLFLNKNMQQMAVMASETYVPFLAIFYYEVIEGSPFGISAFGRSERTGMAAGHKINDPQSKELWNAYVKKITRKKIPLQTEDDQNEYKLHLVLPVRLFVVATRTIYPGEEIFHPYGVDYWQSSDNYFYFPPLEPLDIKRIQEMQEMNHIPLK